MHDLLMIPVAWLGAYWFRFNLEPIPHAFIISALKMLPVVILIQGIVFWYFGLYRGVWRFASMPDLIRIAKAVLLGSAFALIGIFILTRLQFIPRSVFVLYPFILMVLLGGSRFGYRWIKDRKLYKVLGARTLIIGAGRAGETLVRDLLRDPKSEYQPIGFVDDDRTKRGNEIHGLRVLGASKSIPKVVTRNNVDLIMIALPSATSREMQRIVRISESTGLPIRTLPRLQDLISGKATLKEIREVSIEDLLGREQVTLDWNAIRKDLTGKTVLVTGGGGSIGSELCRQIARLEPAIIIVLELSEYNLYAIELELQTKFPGLKFIPKLGDVGDPIVVNEIFQQLRPQIVFHAAAYKHVPLLEQQIRIAAKNNILGTRNIALAADKYGSDAFVLISTDKAVNPSNIMGTTKRIAEIYCQNLNAISATRYITVRFGNVLDSAGSVIPLFRRQIESGGPITVTHKDITRYFMTIPEATQLILQAGAMGAGGEIFVLDMGEPVKISYLAEQMISLSGKQPGIDIDIVYTGLRPGEKLYEELFHNEEGTQPTQHEKILVAESRSFNITELNRLIDHLDNSCKKNDIVSTRDILDELVPENNVKDITVDDSAVSNSLLDNQEKD